MNNTFRALTLFPCDGLDIENNNNKNMHDPYWRQTILGCMVLEILQDMYKFNISYVVGGGDTKLTVDERREAVNPPIDSIDIYVKPLSITPSLLDNAFAVLPIFNWRVGFILRDDNNYAIQRLYSLPFTSVVWSCICAMIFIGSLLFYVLGKWERRLAGNRHCSFVYEVFIAVSAVCQHILPLHAVLCSRRIAYFSFIMGTYVIHCFYTSNLLSRLVSGRDDPMGLEELANSDYEIALLKDMKLSSGHKLHEVPLDKNLSIVVDKLKETKMMDVGSALDAVMYGKTALITDFDTLHPIIQKLYPLHEICDLVEIDLYSNIEHYLITSKEFVYIEEFRTGIIRLRENGILQAISLPPKMPIACHDESIYRRTEMEQMNTPIVLLLIAYALATLILIGEKIHYSRNKIWAYTE